jgi:hypothetical protein
MVQAKPVWYANSLYVPSLKQVVVFANEVSERGSDCTGLPEPNDSDRAGTERSVCRHNVFGYLGQDKNNVAPRLGFAYEALHNTVVRGAFGIYYNLLPSNYVDTAPFTTLPFVACSDLHELDRCDAERSR